MVDTSLWNFDEVSHKDILKKSKLKLQNLIFQESNSSALDVDFNYKDENRAQEESQNYLGSLDEEVDEIGNSKINPYFNLLKRLEIEAQESEEVIQKRNNHKKLLIHLESVSENFCKTLKTIETSKSEDDEFLHRLDPEELQFMFGYNDSNNLNLCGQIDVVIKDETVYRKDKFIQPD